MLTHRRIAVVGSREVRPESYAQLKSIIDSYIVTDEDIIVSGGAVGVDSMAQRYAKENGYDILIHYPKYKKFGRPATFIRNEKIVRSSDLVIAFYRKGHFQEGGTANSASWARKLNIELHEYEEE